MTPSVKCSTHGNDRSGHLPLDMVAFPRRFDAQKLYHSCHFLPPIDAEGWGKAFDVDGCYTHYHTLQVASFAYTYLLRSGAIEAVDATILAASQNIGYGSFEPAVIKAMKAYFKMLVILQVPPPYALFLSLLNVKGKQMPTPRGGHPINRDHLFLPELVFQEPPSSVEAAMFPCFNLIWNACGLPQSLNYDEQGNWDRKS